MGRAAGARQVSQSSQSISQLVGYRGLLWAQMHPALFVRSQQAACTSAASANRRITLMYACT